MAPPVLVYDQAGNLVKSWGGPGQGYDWPDSNHGITVDHQGNVWLAGNGQKDTQVLKFDGAGKFLLQIGKHGVHNGSNDTDNLWQPTKIFTTPGANEVYIADGYGNRRVIVFDATPAKYKRHWGAYGNKPNDDKMPPYNPSAPRLEAVQHRALRDRVERRSRLRLRSCERSHPGVSQRRHVREGSRHRPRRPIARDRYGT